MDNFLKWILILLGLVVFIAFAAVMILNRYIVSECVKEGNIIYQENWWRKGCVTRMPGVIAPLPNP